MPSRGEADSLSRPGTKSAVGHRLALVQRGSVNAVTGGLVDVPPVLERSLQHFVASKSGQDARDGVDQAVPGVVVHHLVDQRVGLAEVVVFGVQGVSGAHHLSISGPHGLLGVGVGVGAGGRRDGVGVVDGVGYAVYAHGPVFGVTAYGRLGTVYGNLLVVHSEPGAVGVGVGEPSGEQHLVW